MNFFKWVLIVGVAISTHANATLLTVKGNVVWGAKNINVNGVLYDAEFGQNYLENNSIFDNYDKAQAGILGMALLNQVFAQIDFRNGEYINGCGSKETWCSAYTFMKTTQDEAFMGASIDGNLEWNEGWNKEVREKFSYIFSTSNDNSYITTVKWSLAGAEKKSG